MAVTIAGGSAACNGDNHADGSPEYSFLFTENPVMVGASGGTVSTMIISDIGYTPAAVDSWITDVAAEDPQTITFKVEANAEQASRDGKIAFHIEGTEDVKELTVRQAASSGGLKCSKESVDFDTVGGEEEITVSSPVDWEVEECPAWITAVKKNASALVLSAPVNYAGKAQTGNVVVSTSTAKAVISVKQKNDPSLFLGATTVMGRRFAYNAGGLVTTVTTDKSYSLAEGVDVLEIKYTGKSSGSVLPYYVYVMEVDLSRNVSLLATCKDDDPANIMKTPENVTGVQIVRDQLAAMEGNRNGKVVYGGINGDFFFGEGSANENNSLLHGVMHKDGVCLKETFDGGSACSVFAMMKDGTARILSQSAYKSSKDDIQEAVGGRQEVLNSGTVTSASNKKYDPRTAVGVSADRKKVIMLVVDGRRSSHSNGADYPELGTMLKAMGAYNGINLDGGGSSTFVVKEGSGFAVRNRPSDDKERKVVNGLAIISK